MKMIFKFLLSLSFLLFLVATDKLRNAEELIEAKTFPIVYSFTMKENACKRGLPNYLIDTINQAVETQIDCCQVYIISSFSICKSLHNVDLGAEYDKRAIQIDYDEVKSKKTERFMNSSDMLFAADGLWTMSAVRFFLLEDLMRLHKFNHLLHIEGDNLLFGKVGSNTIPYLRKGYPRLAATILAPHLATASVLWVGELSALSDFNDWLLTLALNNTKSLTNYIDWLWPRSCCMPASRGGMFPDASGNGIRPYAVNEMSMMGYYHELNKTEMEYLPSMPQGAHVLNKRHFNVTEFTAGGREVGPSTGFGVWDSGSYGQYIGGTPRFRGRNKGFIDFGHVIGQGIIRAGCTAKFMCGNTTGERNICRMAPYVECSDTEWTPIHNLHVHCKLTSQFKNVECPCRATGMPYSEADEKLALEKQKEIEEELAKSGNKSVPIIHIPIEIPTSSTSNESDSKIAPEIDPTYTPIVYFYIINAAQCASGGLPLYIKDAVTQALSTQSSDVYLISSFSACKSKTGKDIAMGYPESVKLIDYDEIKSEKTKKFIDNSVNILGSDGLWATSAIRFLSLHDLMSKMHWKHMLHVESDNLLYEDLSREAIPAMRNGYRNLAATMLSGTFVTASVFWVGNSASLDKFNTHLLLLTNESSAEFLQYLAWVRPFACCLSEARGGLYPDKDGNRIRPFAINEMTMLTHYNEIQKDELQLLPLLPTKEEGLITKRNNLVAFAVGGDMVGPATGNGVWDPGSYGQYLGGTPGKKGNNKKFIDFSHILGQGMIKSACFPFFLCGPELLRVKDQEIKKSRRQLSGIDVSKVDLVEYLKNLENEGTSSPTAAITLAPSSRDPDSPTQYPTTPIVNGKKCQRAPYVRCGVHDDAYNVTFGPWKQILNLHVHSKHTSEFLTTPCACRESIPYVYTEEK